MHIAVDARLILRWTCQVCHHVNYYDSAGSPAMVAECAKAEQEMGMEPGSLAIVPDKLHCAKCEELHTLPDDLGER